MGKELPLARKEEEGQSMLLAITGSGEPITTSCNRNKRTKKSNPSKVSEGGETEDTETEGKIRRKTKRANASSPKRQRRRRDNKDRESDRGDEGADKSIRRSAQELGVVFPGSYCDDAELTPHYWTETSKFDRGSLFQCRFCRRHIWLPTYFLDNKRLGEYMRKYGKTEGYCRYLNRYRPAKLLMAKLQDLRRLQAEVTDKMEFARLTDKILSDKEYDRKE